MGSLRARALRDGCKHSTFRSQLFKCAKPDPSAPSIYLFNLSDSLHPGSRAKCALRVAVWDANGDFWASPFLHPALKRRIVVLCTPSWCLFLSAFYVHSLLRTGICTDRCPPCSAILLLSHKTGKGERGGLKDRGGQGLVPPCTASGEFSGITSPGKAL